MSSPAAKRQKQGTEDEDEEEQRTFTACQMLCGNLDHLLPGGSESRATSVLDLFNVENGNDDDTNMRSAWSLESTRQQAMKIISSGECLFNQFRLLLVGTEKDDVNWKLLRLPILSMAHVQRANELIEAICAQREPQENYKLAHVHVTQALESWPCNPSALICLANMKRMGVVDDALEKDRLRMVLDLYLAAGRCAFVARESSLAVLNDTRIRDDDKFLVESIVLLLAAQVEETENDDEDEKESSEADPQPRYSNSKVLVTSSYMSALLASALGHHNIAERVLQRFGSSITRIHPKVWDTAMMASAKSELQKQLPSHHHHQTQGSFCPTLFPDAVPNDLFETLRHAFRPDAPYWEQSEYNRNVYYSFWTDWPLPRPKPELENSFIASNAVEHYIVSYLLPRVKSVCGLKDLAGFEWWVHTRPHAANLGHQLHFDTDEALLEQDGVVDYPISASVTYLTMDDATHGSTILFDQTPETTENAQVGWIILPKSRSFLIFPGNLLHGVLPCVTNDDDPLELDSAGPKPHRLTFMVNFWATRIPDRLKERKLYGPSGPFPPSTPEHSWVNDIMSDSYPKVVELPTTAVPSPCQDGLLSVSPVWDCIKKDGAEEAIDLVWDVSCVSLDLPLSGGVNQRFFVKNAPKYFSSTLHEK